MPTRRRNTRVGLADGRGEFSGNLVKRVQDDLKRVSYYDKTYRDWRGFFTERAALRLLATTALPVPRIIPQFPEPSQPTLRLTRLRGVRPVRARMQSDEYMSLCSAFGAILRNLHAATLGRRYEAPEIPVRNVDYVIAHMESLATAEWYAPAIAVLESQAQHLERPESDLVLVHRDARLDNLLWDPGSGTISLLDFEVAIWGLPDGDLARVLTTELAGRNAANKFYEGYWRGDSAHADGRGLKFHQLVYCIEMLSWLQRPQNTVPAERGLQKRLVAKTRQLVAYFQNGKHP